MRVQPLRLVADDPGRRVLQIGAVEGGGEAGGRRDPSRGRIVSLPRGGRVASEARRGGVTRNDLAHRATPARPSWLRCAKPRRSTSPFGGGIPSLLPAICDCPAA